MAVIDLLSFDNVVFEAYVFWSAVLVLKLLFMGALTAAQRYRTMTFANAEDLFNKKLKLKFDDPDVERVRRAHRNDLENILPFLIIGLLYVLINPAAFLAVILFRVVAISRIIHTLVYAVVVLPQPARALSFFMAMFPTTYMTLQVLIYAL